MYAIVTVKIPEPQFE
ncbi:MAG: hypothetical protein EOM23_03055 [Candidatus Moranbacteria bacterium]|nr:hypothetical protein [Candidatus Moranbacteria bacterium]